MAGFSSAGDFWKKPRRLDRVRGPTYVRAGRGIPAGGKRNYPLVVALPEGATAPAPLHVTAASFFVGSSIETPPIKINGLRESTYQGDQGTLPSTLVALSNTTDCVVDAFFEATAKSPNEAATILRLTVPPRFDGELTVEDLPLSDEYQGGRTFGARIVALKLVDWSVIRRDGKAESMALLTTAWERTARWPEPRLPFEAAFAFASDEGGEKQAAGRLEIDAAGQITAHVESMTADIGRVVVERFAGQVFAPLTRPSATAAVAGRTVGMWAADEVRCDGPSFMTDVTMPTLVRADALGLAEFRSAEGDHGIRRLWSRRTTPFGSVVTRNAFFQPIFGEHPQEVLNIDYAFLPEGPYPTRSELIERQFDMKSTTRTTLVLTKGRFKNPVATGAAESAPADPSQVRAAAALAAAWNATYRYPETPVTLTGRFKIGGNLNDGVWMGERKLEGTFRLEQFRGMRNDASRWTRAVIDVETTRSSYDKVVLSTVVEDRFRMWAFRDFVGRASFAEFFRLATIRETPEKPGEFEITNGPVRRVVVKDGRIHRIEGDGTYSSGERWSQFEHKVVDGRSLVTLIRSGAETCSAEFRVLNAEWTLPIRMKFEKVFGDKWGPEELVFEQLKIEP